MRSLYERLQIIMADTAFRLAWLDLPVAVYQAFFCLYMVVPDAKKPIETILVTHCKLDWCDSWKLFLQNLYFLAIQNHRQGEFKVCLNHPFDLQTLYTLLKCTFKCPTIWKWSTSAWYYWESPVVLIVMSLHLLFCQPSLMEVQNQLL